MPIADALTKHLKLKDLIPAAGYIDGKWIETAGGRQDLHGEQPLNR